MKKTNMIGFCFLILLPLWGGAQDKLPVPAAPGSWVND